MKKITMLALVAGLAFVQGVDAQVRIVKAGSQKYGFDYSGFKHDSGTAAVLFRKTLESDLTRSGFFVTAPAGAGELLLQGSVQGGLAVGATVMNKGSQRVYLNKSYNGTPEQARRLAHVVADDIIFAITGKRGMNGGRLVLVGNRTGAKQLYLADADGQGLVQLTSDKAFSIAPNWSPDGRMLYYTSDLKGYPDVYSIELASGARKRMAAFPGLNTGAAVSPDGRTLALILSKDGNPEMYLMDVGSRQLTRLTNTKGAGEASPCWSPDGRSIAYVSDISGRPHIYVMGRSGGSPTRITTRGNQNVAPDWGANGLIAYASLVGGKFGVFVTDPQGGGNKQVSPADGANYEDPSWAPDGRHLACGRSVGYKSKIVLLDYEGDPWIPLLDSSGDWFSPAWTAGK